MKKVVGVFSVLSLGVGFILLTGGNEYGVVGLFYGLVGAAFVDKSIALEE
jgi:hypothetical protein